MVAEPDVLKAFGQVVLALLTDVVQAALKDVEPVESMAFEQAELTAVVKVVHLLLVSAARCLLPVFYLPVASFRPCLVGVYFRFYRCRHCLDG